MRRAVVFLWAISLAGATFGAGDILSRRDTTRGFGKALRIPDDVELIRNVEYGKGGDKPLHLDILRPKTPPANPMPVLVWIHGGSWRSGTKAAGLRKLIPFARRGYFCATIEYRYSWQAPFPAQIEDCKCAIRYLRAHVEEYGIDPDRIGVWGRSAGGHLAALLGTSGGVPELEGEGGWQDYSSRVQAVCDWSGPTDLAELDDSWWARLPTRSLRPHHKLIGCAPADNPAKADAANPIAHVTADCPPFLIIHGDKDSLVPISQAEKLYDALRNANVDAAFHVVQGAGHALRGRKLMKIVQEFFDKHLIQNAPQASGSGWQAS